MLRLAYSRTSVVVMHPTRLPDVWARPARDVSDPLTSALRCEWITHIEISLWKALSCVYAILGSRDSACSTGKITHFSFAM